MFPGRLYTFSLRTVSGATGPRALSTHSSAIHIKIRTSRWQRRDPGNHSPWFILIIFTCIVLKVPRGCVNDGFCGGSAEPQRVPSLHCRPQSSTSISCSWAPPEADYDSYTIECLHQDSRTLVYSRRTGRDSSAYVITQLEPHKRYRVSVKVISAGVTSEEAQDSVVTMIDRKAHSGGCCRLGVRVR